MDAPRRDFFRTVLGDAEAHVTSLLLQVLPAARESVRAALDARPRCTTTLAGNRIVLVAELDHERELADLMGEIAELPGVLSVSLVYHQVESRDAMNEELADDDDPS